MLCSGCRARAFPGVYYSGLSGPSVIIYTQGLARPGNLIRGHHAAAPRPYGVELETLAPLPRRPRGDRAGASGPRAMSRSSTVCRLDPTAPRGDGGSGSLRHRELRNKEGPEKKGKKKKKRRGPATRERNHKEDRREGGSAGLSEIGERGSGRKQVSTAEHGACISPLPGSNPRNPPSPPPRYSFPLLDPPAPAAAPALTSHQTYIRPAESFLTFPHIGSPSLVIPPCHPSCGRRRNAEAPGVPRHGLVSKDREGLGAGSKLPMRGSLCRRRIGEDPALTGRGGKWERCLVRGYKPGRTGEAGSGPRGERPREGFKA